MVAVYIGEGNPLGTWGQWCGREETMQLCWILYD